MARVGILGLGKMGSEFALILLSKGNEVHVYNRSKQKLRELVGKGAIAHPSPLELARAVDVVITSLTDHDVVDSVVVGKDGALQGMRRGSLWIEMSTIDPDASIRQAEQAKLLSQLGPNVFYLGGPGSGHKMKLIFNLHLATIGLAFSEAFVLSRKLGFEPGVFVDALNKTALKNYFSKVKGPLISKGDYSPLFTVNMMLKDLTLAENQATRHRVALPGGSIVKQLFMTGANQGQGEMDFTSIALTLQKLNGVELLSAVPS